MSTRTLAYWRFVIEKEAPYINRRPYSHNIIGVALGAIADAYGKDEADRAIVDFKLYAKGWADPRAEEAP